MTKETKKSQYKNKMAVPTGHHNNSVLTYDTVQTQQQEEIQENDSNKIIINSNLSLQSRTEMSKVTFRRSTTLTYHIKCVPYRVYKVQRKSDTQSSRYPKTYVHAIISKAGTRTPHTKDTHSAMKVQQCCIAACAHAVTHRNLQTSQHEYNTRHKNIKDITITI